MEKPFGLYGKSEKFTPKSGEIKKFGNSSGREEGHMTQSELIESAKKDEEQIALIKSKMQSMKPKRPENPY